MPSLNITQLLVTWSDGNREALDALTPLVQQKLTASPRHMAGQRPEHILHATADRSLTLDEAL